MKYIKQCLYLTTISFSIATYASHQFGTSIDYINGENNVQGVRLGIQYHTDWAESWIDDLHLYFDTSVNYWEYNGGTMNDSTYVVSLSPVLQYPLFSIFDYLVIGEIGIGFALLDDTHFAGKDIGSQYHFEDRIGLLTTFGESEQHSIHIRYLHYSNAGFEEPNPGLDFIGIGYSYRF